MTWLRVLEERVVNSLEIPTSMDPVSKNRASVCDSVNVRELDELARRLEPSLIRALKECVKSYAS